MNEIVKSNIENLIYEVRGVQVMLDSDLARLYQCKNGTKEINQAVKNNINKFPERYSWKLSEEESKEFLVKNFDQKVETRGGKYKNPRVFTEQGVAMLATVLKSKIACDMTIAIMDSFVRMRHYIGNSELRLSNIETKVIEYDNRLKLVEDTLDSFKSDIKVNQVFYNGQIYDAYSCIVDIMNKGKSDVIVIDNYADKSVLDMISKVKCSVTLITKSKTLISKIDLEKYYKQYNNLKVIYNNDFHDRFIILDKGIIYHLGSSINHAGNKIFCINIIEDNDMKKILLDKITR